MRMLDISGLGAAVAAGYEGVHLTDSYEERGGDEGDVLGEDPTAGLLTAVLRPVLCHELLAGVVWISSPELGEGALVVLLSPAARVTQPRPEQFCLLICEDLHCCYENLVM